MSDQNNDNTLMEEEVLTNPNRAIVWKWAYEIDKYPAMKDDLKSVGGMDRMKYLSYYNANTTGKYIL